MIVPSVAFIILLALVTSSLARDTVDKLFDKLADKMFTQVIRVPPFDHADLDSTALGKSGHLAIGPRMSLGSIPTLPQRQPIHGDSIHGAGKPSFQRTLLARAKGPPSRNAVAKALRRPAVQQCMATAIAQAKDLQKKMKTLRDDPELKPTFTEMEKELAIVLNEAKFLQKVEKQMGDVTADVPKLRMGEAQQAIAKIKVQQQIVDMQEKMREQQKYLNDPELSNKVVTPSKDSKLEIPTRAVAMHKEVDKKDDDNGRAEGVLLMLVATLLWGSNFPAVKAMEVGLPASMAAASRFTVAAASLLPLLRKANRLPGEVLSGGLECGAWNALAYFSQALALQDLPAGVVAFLVSLQVVFVPLMQTFRGDALTKRLALAACLCVAGVGLLESGGMGGVAGDAPSSLVAATLLALLQPIGFGVCTMKLEDLMKKYPGTDLPLAALQQVSTAVIGVAWLALDMAGVLPGGAHSGGFDFSALQQPEVVAGVMYTGLVTTALTVVLETRALSKLPAADAAVITGMEPLWAAGFAALLLGERMDSHTLIGAGLILCGCLSNSLLPANLNPVDWANNIKAELTGHAGRATAEPKIPDAGAAGIIGREAKLIPIPVEDKGPI